MSWLIMASLPSAGVGRSVWEKGACRYTSLKTIEVFISSPIKVPLRALEKSLEEWWQPSACVTLEMKRVCENTLDNNKRNRTPRTLLGQYPNKYGDELILRAESK